MLSIAPSKWRIRGITIGGNLKDYTRWRVSPSVRSYSADVSQNDTSNDLNYCERCDPRTFFQGSITTSSPSTTPLRALLTSLEHYQTEWRSNLSNDFHDAVLLLLLTPAYARHALDPNFPVQALQSMSGEKTSKRPLRAITAVVDGVPGTELGGGGHEGLAYLYQQLTENEHGITTHKQPEIAQVAQKYLNTKIKSVPNELEFLFQGFATAYLDEARMPDSSANKRTYAVTLPLAQTLFTTGRETTMQLARYTPTSDTDSRLKFDGLEELNSAQIYLPFTPNSETAATRHQVAMTLPLMPLTPVRTVENCLGNVVKSISSHRSFGRDHSRPEGLRSEGQDTATQPASQELEEMISAHFAKQKIPPAPVEVYALVMPQSIESLAVPDELFRYQIARLMLRFRPEKPREFAASTVNQAIRDLIIIGKARLCKVLSGGGGWGDKKGLLSLDPDSYGPLEESEHINGDGLGKESNQPQNREDAYASPGMRNFKPAVKVGEHIMFFLAQPEKSRTQPPSISVVDAHGQISIVPDISSQSSETRADDRAVFGVSSSSLDTMPSSAPAAEALLQPDHHNSDPASQDQVTHIPHLFGAFSASPLALISSAAESGSRSVKSKTKLGVVGLNLRIETRQYTTAHGDTQRKAREHTTRKANGHPTRKRQPSREEVEWYVDAGDVPMQRVDLAQLREHRESVCQAEREAKAMIEMQDLETPGRSYDRQNVETESIGRVEELFERMSESSDPDGVYHSKQSGTYVRGQSGGGLPAANQPVGSAAKRALFALKRNNGGRRQYSHQAKAQPETGE